MPTNFPHLRGIQVNKVRHLGGFAFPVSVPPCVVDMLRTDQSFLRTKYGMSRDSNLLGDSVEETLRNRIRYLHHIHI